MYGDNVWQVELPDLGDGVRGLRMERSEECPLVCAVWELAAGATLGPYHLHHGTDELLIVLRGRPTLRTPDGEHGLREGDVVAFPRGKEGAHQIKNGTDEPIRVLMLSTLIAPDLVEYLDSGKIGARSVKGERIMLARPGPELDYWEGED